MVGCRHACVVRAASKANPSLLPACSSHLTLLSEALLARAPYAQNAEERNRAATGSNTRREAASLHQRALLGRNINPTRDTPTGSCSGARDEGLSTSPPSPPCADCTAHGFHADECTCGFCGSFGDCTHSCDAADGRVACTVANGGTHGRTHGCRDDPSFRDDAGLSCADWIGLDCQHDAPLAANSLDRNQMRQYNASSAATVLAACPSACGLCGQQTRAIGRQTLW